MYDNISGGGGGSKVVSKGDSKKSNQNTIKPRIPKPGPQSPLRSEVVCDKGHAEPFLHSDAQ